MFCPSPRYCNGQHVHHRCGRRGFVHWWWRPRLWNWYIVISGVWHRQILIFIHVISIIDSFSLSTCSAAWDIGSSTYCMTEIRYLEESWLTCLFQKRVVRSKYLRVYYYHWVDTSAGGLLVICPVVRANALTYFISYIYYQKILFLNNVIIIKSKVFLCQSLVTLIDWCYPLKAFWFYCSQKCMLSC